MTVGNTTPKQELVLLNNIQLMLAYKGAAQHNGKGVAQHNGKGAQHNQR